MAFYANVVAEAAGFSAKTGIFLDAFSLRPMPDATFPQLRPSIIRPWEQRGARGVDKRLCRRFWVEFERSENEEARASVDVRASENGGYLLSQLVGQYHRRW